MVAIGLTAIPQALQPSGQRRVVGHHGSAVTKRAKILRRIETECARDADGADRPAVARGQVGLTGVFDQGQVVPAGDGLNPSKVGWLPVQVHGQDGRGTRRDGGFDSGWINRQALAVDVGEDRRGPRHRDGER